MFKSLAITTVAITCLVAPASATTSPFGIFARKYSGSASVHNGSLTVFKFYGNFKIKVGALGKVTGSCQNDANKTLAITGRMTTPTVVGGFVTSALIHGSISDGAKWRGTVTAASLSAPQPYILGTCTKGKLSGTLNLYYVP